MVEPGAATWKARRSSSWNLSRRITPVQLLAKFYYNRGVEALNAGEFAVGIDRLQISLAMDPADADARANIVAGLNNWAVERCGARRYDEAATLIERGLSLDPSFGPLVANERLVRTGSAISACTVEVCRGTISALKGIAMPRPLRVTIWNEYVHELQSSRSCALSDGMHAVWPRRCRGCSGTECRHVCDARPEEHGLTYETLAETDVLTWWGHAAHDRVADEIVERVHQRVLNGMGIVALHSAHASRFFAG